MERLRVLIGCEFSGIVREAFRALGHDAWSCDLLPAEDGSAFHIQDDVIKHLCDGWDMAIFHPDCTYLCSSGMHWTTRGLRDPKLTEDALDFVRLLMAAPIHRIAIENPIGRINTAIRPPDCYIQPYEYGHDASKKTGLWLKNLPPLRPIKLIDPRIVDGKRRWANQCDSGQNKLGPSDDRWKLRARTYQGWANAFADQWGDLLEN